MEGQGKFNGKGGTLAALKERQDLKRQKQVMGEGKEWLKLSHSGRIGYVMPWGMADGIWILFDLTQQGLN